MKENRLVDIESDFPHRFVILLFSEEVKWFNAIAEWSEMIAVEFSLQTVLDTIFRDILFGHFPERPKCVDLQNSSEDFEDSSYGGGVVLLFEVEVKGIGSKHDWHIDQK